MPKRLYTGFSLFNFLWYMFLRIIIGLGFFLTIPHYEENPVVVCIALGLMAFAFIFFGEDQIVVYPNKIVRQTNSLFNLLFSYKGISYSFENVKEVYIEDKREFAEDKLADIVATIGFFYFIEKPQAIIR